MTCSPFGLALCIGKHRSPGGVNSAREKSGLEVEEMLDLCMNDTFFVKMREDYDKNISD